MTKELYLLCALQNKTPKKEIKAKLETFYAERDYHIVFLYPSEKWYDTDYVNFTHDDPMSIHDRIPELLPSKNLNGVPDWQVLFVL